MANGTVLGEERLAGEVPVALEKALIDDQIVRICMESGNRDGFLVGLQRFVELAKVPTNGNLQGRMRDLGQKDNISLRRPVLTDRMGLSPGHIELVARRVVLATMARMWIRQAEDHLDPMQAAEFRANVIAFARAFEIEVYVDMPRA